MKHKHQKGRYRTKAKNLRHKSVYLLRKGQKGIVHAVFSRSGLILLLMLLQIALILAVFRWIEGILPLFWGASTILVGVAMVYLFNCSMDPTSKLTWLAIIMGLPVMGALFFFYTRYDPGHAKVKRDIAMRQAEVAAVLPQAQSVAENFRMENEGAASLGRYLNNIGGFPTYGNTKVQYFPLGDDMWPVMLEQLEKAEKFIFVEYFIIDEGEMWGSILKILSDKAKAGVEVCVMYDGSCELSTLPHDYPQMLQKLGIQCRMFAPIRPVASTHYNYRDHRKILVIDGKVGFSGGVNLADEYVNLIARFGHWKDTAVMLEGDAVRSLTAMFLEMWSLGSETPDFEKYFIEHPAHETRVNGYVIPFGENPLDGDKTAEWTYIDILNRATKYVHIMTPYLIPDGALMTALKLASERGVDVSIILPGIPDKKIPYALAKTCYAPLLKSGVKVYEYTPGFVHAKVFVADDREAVVGTINLDYRSLYHHYECGVYMYGVDCIERIHEDFENTRSKCDMVTENTYGNQPLQMRVIGRIAKIVAPML